MFPHRFFFPPLCAPDSDFLPRWFGVWSGWAITSHSSFFRSMLMLHRKWHGVPGGESCFELSPTRKRFFHPGDQLTSPFQLSVGERTQTPSRLERELQDQLRDKNRLLSSQVNADSQLSLSILERSKTSLKTEFEVHFEHLHCKDSEAQTKWYKGMRSGKSIENSQPNSSREVRSEAAGISSLQEMRSEKIKVNSRTPQHVFWNYYIYLCLNNIGIKMYYPL